MTELSHKNSKKKKENQEKIRHDQSQELKGKKKSRKKTDESTDYV